MTDLFVKMHSRFESLNQSVFFLNYWEIKETLEALSKSNKPTGEWHMHPMPCCTPRELEGRKKTFGDSWWWWFTSNEGSSARKLQGFPPLQPTGSQTEPKCGIPTAEAYRLPNSRGSREACVRKCEWKTSEKFGINLLHVVPNPEEQPFREVY